MPVHDVDVDDPRAGAITSSTRAPRRAKSAERIEGATRRSPSSSLIRCSPRHRHTCLSIESPQCWQVMSSVVLIRAIVWCSPQLGTARPARSGADSTRSGSGRAAASGAARVRRSPGTAPAQHVLALARPRSSASIIPVQAADEESGRAVAVGAQLEAAPVVGEARAGARSPRSSTRRGTSPAEAARAATRPCPRSRGGRSCRSSRRACRPAAGPAPPGQDPTLQPGQALDRPRRLAPAGVRSRGERAEVRAWRVDQDPVEAVAHAHLGRVRSITVTLRSPSRPACPPPPPPAPGRARPRHLAAVPDPRRDLASLHARARAEVEDVVPGPGSRTSTTPAEPRLCGVSSPAATRVGNPPPLRPDDHDRLRRGQRPGPVGRPAPRPPTREPLDVASRSTPGATRKRSRPARCRRRAASGRCPHRSPPTTSGRARAAPSGRLRRARGSSRPRAAPRPGPRARGRRGAGRR